MRRTTFGSLCLLAGLSLPGSLPASPDSMAEISALRIVDRFPVPNAKDRWIMDLRWAGKDSVYLAELYSGVTEVKLEEGLPEVRRVLPGTEEIGLDFIAYFAITDDWIGAAQSGEVVLARLESDARPVSRIAGVLDLDIRGDELLILGRPEVAHQAYQAAPDGILWKTDLSKGPGGWEVLYRNDEFARDLANKLYTPGSIRFLDSGDFVVAPNFSPRVHRFSSTGRLEMTWGPEDLWGDAPETDEGSPTDPRSLTVAALEHALAAGETIDEILVLSDEPAIVVRHAGDDGPQWRLGVLGAEIRWYEIPVEDASRVARLRGDADDKGRIALVAVPRTPRAHVGDAEILVLEIPE